MLSCIGLKVLREVDEARRVELLRVLFPNDRASLSTGVTGGHRFNIIAFSSHFEELKSQAMLGLIRALLSDIDGQPVRSPSRISLVGCLHDRRLAHSPVPKLRMVANHEERLACLRRRIAYNECYLNHFILN